MKPELVVVKRFESAQDSLVLQSSDLSLDTISKMAESGAIDLSPKYQRRERWTPEAESALIESFLLNVPVPPVYLAEDDFGTYSVIDGKQRITAIYKFLHGKLSLKGLKEYTEIEGAYFSDLPPALKNALNIRPYIRAVTLLKQTDPQLKYEVFTRLNTGGQPLLPQEIRNALYRGALNDLLFELSQKPFLRAQLKIKNNKESAYKEMSDVEMILRFFTLHEKWSNFSGDYRFSMDDFMARNKHVKRSRLTALKDSFSKALDRCEKLWGNSAFHRYVGATERDQFLAAVYDAQMIAISGFSSTDFNAILGNRKKLKSLTIELFKNMEFDRSIRVSTNTPGRVKCRINSVIELLNACR